MVKKRVIEGSPAFENLLESTEKNGMTSAETTDVLATAQALSVSEDQKDHTDLISLLRSLTNPTREPIDPSILQTMEPTKLLGIHLGSIMAVTGCPFGRDFVGVDMSEKDPTILVERSYAEWKTAQTRRRTVIIFKASVPILIYREVQWKTAPVFLPGGGTRNFYGRHYMSSGVVVVLPSKQVFDLSTGPDSEGSIRPILTNPRPMDPTDPLIQYVEPRRRDRKAVQQPIDLLQ